MGVCCCVALPPSAGGRLILSPSAEAADVAKQGQVRHRQAWPNAQSEPPPPERYLRVTAGMPGCCSERVANRSMAAFQGGIGRLYRFLFRPTAAFRQQVHAARVKLFEASSGKIAYLPNSRLAAMMEETLALATAVNRWEPSPAFGQSKA